MFKNCPVFKKECLIHKCHSFFEGNVLKKEEYPAKKWVYFLYEPCCTCSIVTGVVEMQPE
jgi:hypothetical protein